MSISLSIMHQDCSDSGLGKKLKQGRPGVLGNEEQDWSKVRVDRSGNQNLVALDLILHHILYFIDISCREVSYILRY